MIYFVFLKTKKNNVASEIPLSLHRAITYEVTPQTYEVKIKKLNKRHRQIYL